MSESIQSRSRDIHHISRVPILVLFSITLFFSALLLFWVQPMFAKMTLPLLGGAPSIWTTAMLFFQTVLLGGYAYAHYISHRFPVRWQIAIHLTVLGLGAMFLPIMKIEGWVPPSEGVPSLWLIGFYGVCIGAPFFALSASAPLLQRWFSLTRYEHASDPYLLYSSSNIGSMLALLGDPFFWSLGCACRTKAGCGAYAMWG